jgi:competence ComEA-like helix-hairpin-helix protein
MHTAGMSGGFTCLISLAWLLGAVWLSWPAGPAPALAAAPEVPPCPTPVEIRGQGVLCAPPAGRGRILAGDAVSADMYGDERIKGPPARMAPARLLLTGVRIDLNHASLDELLALPGVGPALAGAIIAARPFSTIEDLGRVPGIGRRRAAALAPLVTVR